MSADSTRLKLTIEDLLKNQSNDARLRDQYRLDAPAYSLSDQDG